MALIMPRLTKEQIYVETLRRQEETFSNLSAGSNHQSLFVNFGHGDLQIRDALASSIRKMLIEEYELITAVDGFSLSRDSKLFRTVQVPDYDVSNISSGMIDWFRGEIKLVHDPIPSERFLSIDVDGSISYEIVKSSVARGSHESTIRLRSSMVDSSGIAQTFTAEQAA